MESTPGARALRSGTGKVTEIEQETLPWADYLAIRKKKRRWETVRLLCPRLMCSCLLVVALLFNVRADKAMTIPFTAAGFIGGVMYFGNLDIDPTKPIFVRH